jgi:hypothetical protein
MKPCPDNRETMKKINIIDAGGVEKRARAYREACAFVLGTPATELVEIESHFFPGIDRQVKIIRVRNLFNTVPLRGYMK